MLKLLPVPMNSTDEGAVEEQLPKDFEYPLEKCKQPPCVLSFIFFLKPWSFIKGQFLEMRKVM